VAILRLQIPLGVNTHIMLPKPSLPLTISFVITYPQFAHSAESLALSRFFCRGVKGSLSPRRARAQLLRLEPPPGSLCCRGPEPLLGELHPREPAPGGRRASYCERVEWRSSAPRNCGEVGGSVMACTSVTRLALGSGLVVVVSRIRQPAASASLSNLSQFAYLSVFSFNSSLLNSAMQTFFFCFRHQCHPRLVVCISVQ
jgi:hypothetical protein